MILHLNLLIKLDKEKNSIIRYKEVIKKILNILKIL